MEFDAGIALMVFVMFVIVDSSDFTFSNLLRRKNIKDYRKLLTKLNCPLNKSVYRKDFK